MDTQATLPTEAKPGLRASLNVENELESTKFDVADPTEGVWARVASEGRGVSLPRPIANKRLREHFGRRGIRDAKVAPLLSREKVIGTMLVAVGRYGSLGARQSGRLTDGWAEDGIRTVAVILPARQGCPNTASARGMLADCSFHRT